MNEQLESLKQYVSENRAGGVPDLAIRQELLGKGWKVSDVDTVLGQDPSVSTSMAAGWTENARTMHIILAGGAAVSLAAIASFTARFGGDTGFAPFFLVADLLNIITAYAIWKKTLFASRSIWYRICIGILLIPATVFAVGSTIFFLDACVESLGITLYSRDTIEGAEIILFLLGLPVQVVVYLLSSLTVGILYLRRKKAGQVPLTISVLRGHVYFLILAALSTATLFLGLHF